MMLTSKGIMRGVFRVSIVAALLSGAYIAYQEWIATAETYRDHQNMLRTLECGARKAQESLKASLNERGLIDLTKVGCATERFFASFEELRRARDGTIREAEWLSKGPSIDIPAVAGASLAALVIINLLGLIFVGARVVFYWVADGFKPRP